ncbi:hypothetical protein [Sediminicurvatus halobius]|uniref:hypothetical protein n=1 Tax=Sediminicurvatus halobius TaxID=2182432 RepID=UPI001304D8F9|nr:hypothetical protein [Spiribacter halobius]UEX76628.1 hypothetical protein LMH63_11750 [Spiribacter halobius]
MDSGSTIDPHPDHHRVAIVGGGVAGIGLAAALRSFERSLEFTLVELAQTHCY